MAIARSDEPMGHSTETRRSDTVWLLAIVIFAFVFRLVLAGFPRVIRWDEPDYLWLGASLLQGRGYTISGVPELHYTPLLPILSGAISLLTGNPEFGTSFWYVLLGALTVVPVYLFARETYGRTVAFLSAALTAIFPALSSTVLYWGTMTEPLFLFILYTALWVAFRAIQRDSLWRYALTGVLMGLAFLARPEGIVWLAAYAFMFLVVWALRRTLWRWRTILCLLLYLSGYIALASPYAVYMHQYTGKWMATGKLGITYDIGGAVLERDPVRYDEVTASLDAESGEILWWSDKRFERGLMDHLIEDPTGFFTRIWRNAARMRDAILSSMIFSRYLALPVVLAWFRRPWSRRRLTHEIMLWCTILPVLSFLPFHVEVRFFSPAFPALVIWLAAGVWAISAWVVETWGNLRRVAPPATSDRARHRVALALLVLVVAFLGVQHVRVIRHGMDGLPYAHKAAGLWLRENSPANAAIMSRDLAISLYAERGFVASPRSDYAEYLDYAMRKGADYLVVDEHELLVLRPHLAFLLDDANPPPELTPVYHTSDARGRTIVYRIKG